MTPKFHRFELDESLLLLWIAQIRSHPPNSDVRKAAEDQLYKSLAPISSWLADLQSNPAGYDREQVVQDSIQRLLEKYVNNPNFHFHSVGHVVRIVSKITTNQRRKAYRWLNQGKRSHHDQDGHSLPIHSFDLGLCDCDSKSDDPACACEQSDEIEYYSQLLQDESHRQVYRLLVAQFSWPEIAVKLGFDLKTVRLRVDQMRRVLAPHAEALNTQHSILNTQHPRRASDT
jgi:DNA-directed RNA polymerase specialized sigma24 family protein